MAKQPDKAGNKPANKPANKAGNKPAGKKNDMKPLKDSVYGNGGRAGWLKQWNNWFTRRGLDPMTPKEWARLTGYKPPKFAKGAPDGGLAGSMPSFSQFARDDAHQLAAVNYMTGKNYSSMEEALGDLGPEFSFSGATQFQKNMSGPGGQAEVRGNPSLQNVSMVDPLRDQNARNLLLGALGSSFFGEGSGVPGAGGGRKSVDELLAGYAANSPSWAQEVADKLHAGGGRFSTELFSDPNMNFMDPNAPLFPAGSMPQSLNALGVLQAGERDLLSQYTAQQLMEQLYPIYDAYTNRPAGSPVPAGMEAGLTLGQPTQQGGRSPVMGTPVAQAYAQQGTGPLFTGSGVAEGYPGAAGQAAPPTGVFATPNMMQPAAAPAPAAAQTPDTAEELLRRLGIASLMPSSGTVAV